MKAISQDNRVLIQHAFTCTELDRPLGPGETSELLDLIVELAGAEELRDLFPSQEVAGAV